MSTSPERYRTGAFVLQLQSCRTVRVIWLTLAISLPICLLPKCCSTLTWHKPFVTLYSIYGNCHICLDLCEVLDPVQFLLHLIKLCVMRTLAYVGRDIARKWVVSCTTQPQYPWGNRSVDRRLGGPRSLFGLCEEEKDICFCWESNSDSPAVQLVVYALHLNFAR